MFCGFVSKSDHSFVSFLTASEKSVQKRNKMFLSPGKESKSFSDFGKLCRQDEVDRRMQGLEGQGQEGGTVEVEEDDEEVEILALQGNSQDMWENYVEVIESEDEDEQDGVDHVSIFSIGALSSLQIVSSMQ